MRSFTSGDNEAIGLINAFTMADQQDSLRIHLSLVSHTNIGKTTLARTLLMRDVGEIADRAHVTETTDDDLLAVRMAASSSSGIRRALAIPSLWLNALKAAPTRSDGSSLKCGIASPTNLFGLTRKQ